jgi:uncharacterized damage-inducible protein DinB
MEYPGMRALRAELLGELERAHAGQPWHGPARADVLKDLSAARAAWKPREDAHSIWELVLHMRSWTDVVLQRAKGRVAGEPDAGDWPPVPEQPSELEWQAALRSLDAAHEALLDFVRSVPESRLEERVGTGSDPSVKGISVRAMLHSLVHHDVYHPGQCAMLRRLAAEA